MILLKILKKVIFIFTKRNRLFWERTFGLFLLAEEIFIFFPETIADVWSLHFSDTHNALLNISDTLAGERGISLPLELVFPRKRENTLFLPGERGIALCLPGRERTHLLWLPGEGRITLFLPGEESTKILILNWERWVTLKIEKSSDIK